MADISGRSRKKEIIQEERDCHSAQLTGKMPFDGIPHIVIGKLAMECSYGKRSVSHQRQLEHVVIFCYTLFNLNFVADM